MTTIPDDIMQWPADRRDEWLNQHDDGNTLLEFIKRFSTPPPPPVEDTPMQVLTVRMPVTMVEELTHAAGEHIEGRSGLIRTAVAQYLERRKATIADLKAGPQYTERQEAA